MYESMVVYVADMAKYMVFDSAVCRAPDMETCTYRIIPLWNKPCNATNELLALFRQLMGHIGAIIHPQRTLIGVDVLHPALFGNGVSIPLSPVDRLTGDIVFLRFIAAVKDGDDDDDYDRLLVESGMTIKVTLK